MFSKNFLFTLIRIKMLWISIFVFALTNGCQKNKKVSSTSTSDNEASESSFSSNGGELTANKSSEIAGTSLLIPAGSLALPSSIKLETGSDIVDDSVASELSLGSEVTFTKDKAAVSVSTSSPSNPVNPMSLSIPISSTQLTAESKNYVIIYKALVYGETNKILLGVLPSSSLTLTSTSVTFEIKYFGSYQLATTTSTVTQAKSVETTIPIISKSAATKLTPFQISDPTAVYDSTTRKTTFTYEPGSNSIASCSVIIDNDKVAPWTSAVRLGTTTSYEADALSNSAHSIYSKFACQDNYGRSASSNWTNAVAVEALVVAPSVTYPPALAIFAATIPRGRYSVKLALTYPSNVSEYQSVSIYKSSGSTAPDCGSGTHVTTYNSNFSSTVYYYDVPGSGVYSYRACITGVNGGTTNSNTVTAAATNSEYVMFLTSQGYNGNLMATFDGQTFSSGYEGADYRCNYHARSVGIGGNWKALLGGGSVTAISRTSPPTGSTAVDIDGSTVINMSSSGFWAKLNSANNGFCVNGITPFITASTDKDQTGAVHSAGASYFWNGSNSDATSSNNHCANWTSSAAAPTYGSRGNPTCTGSLWLNNGLSGCDELVKLMCISAD